MQLSEGLVIVHLFVGYLKDIAPFKKTRLFCLLHCGLPDLLYLLRFFKFILVHAATDSMNIQKHKCLHQISVLQLGTLTFPLFHWQVNVVVRA